MLAGLTVAYVIDWSPTQIDWLIDGVVVRTVRSASVHGAVDVRAPLQELLPGLVAQLLSAALPMS